MDEDLQIAREPSKSLSPHSVVKIFEELQGEVDGVEKPITAKYTTCEVQKPRDGKEGFKTFYNEYLNFNELKNLVESRKKEQYSYLQEFVSPPSDHNGKNIFCPKINFFS